MYTQFLSSFGFLVLVVVVVVVGYYFSADAVARRRMKRAPRKEIGSLEVGEVVVVAGRATPMEEVAAAPLSGRRCMAYTAILQEQVKSGKSRHWRTIFKQVYSTPFYVEGPNGRLRVEAPSPHLLLHQDWKESSGFLKDASPELVRCLASLGQSTTNFLGMNRTLRYQEAVLEPDEEVVVLGQVRHAPGSSGHFGGRELRLCAPEDGPLVVSDEEQMVRRS